MIPNRMLAITCALAVFALTFTVGKLAFWTYEATATPDPDSARFMLECTHDWMLSPQECRNILNGEDPTVPPPEAGC